MFMLALCHNNYRKVCAILELNLRKEKVVYLNCWAFA